MLSVEKRDKNAIKVGFHIFYFISNFFQGKILLNCNLKPNHQQIHKNKKQYRKKPEVFFKHSSSK